MMARFSAVILAVCLTLSGAAEHLGHLCDAEGPVMASDCCCGSDSDQKAASHAPMVELPACCDGSTDVVSHQALSSTEHKVFKVGIASVSAAISDGALARDPHSVEGQLRLRAPPDPPNVPIYLRHQSLLI